MRKRVAIIGGGITGLAAAVRIRDQAPPDTDIIVYEQSGALGGKLRTGELTGATVERGAEAFLAGAPDGTESAAVHLARRLSLGDALVHPSAVQAALAVGGRLEPIPAGTLMGIPRAYDGDDRDTGTPLLGPHDDVTVGALVRARYGDDVVNRLVDPLLGGVYAGQADQLSLAATMPALAAAARTEHTLTAAVRAAQAGTVRVPGRPMFATINGGLSRLVEAAAAASGARINLGLPVHGLARTENGWRLQLAAAPAGHVEDVDAVVLAVPATAASRLLRSAGDTSGSAVVGALSYASVALVAMALPSDTPLPELSGFLVPPTEGTLVKAATFVTRKWPAPGPPDASVIIRASLGHAGDQQRLQHDDTTLAEHAHTELGTLLDADLPPPIAFWVQRWEHALPQYRTGHLQRIASARAGLPPGLALAGAAYDGIGIPACITSGEAAADDVSKYLACP
ncbi:protoporphyrinogen oxidase [Micromonospora orduensis]|uniref:Coproporphyrinogen III oxidase n=1 Tax=Micromonospora orduensis TaxID=1420891 RepID=A0A5C4QNJ0_9ACTN|nr:protoporphyrinogen oxidase [Micromonospora orduensis]TNH28491.1 protoporphyrinogen oxidase [Micromonospora orduensis]